MVLTYAVRLDDALRNEARIDVLKCDIDGHDCRAIRGGLATLARARPVVFAEFSPGTLRSFSEVEPIEYLKLFTALDYRITILLRRRDPIPCGQDAGRVMSALEATGLDQVDLMLTPPGDAGRLGPPRRGAGA